MIYPARTKMKTLQFIMLFKSTQKKLLILAATLGLTTALSAQVYQLPGAHADQHRDLIAGQANIGNKISVDATQDYIDKLFQEEEEPELDIYEEGWNSRSVNPYNAANVPFSATIDVSDFCMPHPGYITSPYGYRKRFKRMHKGVDLKLNIGDTIRAAFDGRVRLTNYEGRGYGNYIIVRHNNQLETVYGHLSGFIAKEGDYVKAGDPIALGGNTGRSTGPHLHFETRYMGYAINPSAIFDFANQTVHTDSYTFTKDTYQNARNFDADANSAYAAEYRQMHPTKAAPASSGSKAGRKSYTVKKGDTLGRIASRNGVTLRQLCKLNGLKTSSKIRPGQKLRLK